MVTTVRTGESPETLLKQTWQLIMGGKLRVAVLVLARFSFGFFN